MGKEANKLLYSENDEILEHINEFRLFSEFPKELLDALLSMGKVEKFKMGTTILKEGQKNTKLYFLLSGSLSVEVGNKQVSFLRRKGDVFGEMSIIADKPCAASVIAHDDVEALAMEANILSSDIENKSAKAQAALYRIYSLLLCDKLKITNDKAKEYEGTNERLKETQDALQNINHSLEQRIDQSNRELKQTNRELEQQNRVLQTSFHKLHELNQLKQKTFERLLKIDKDKLPVIYQQINRIIEGENEEQNELFLDLQKELKDLNTIISPLVAENSPHTNLRNKRLLIAESVKKLQNLSKNALGGTGIKLDIASSEEEAKKLLVENEYDTLISSTEFIELMPFAKEKSPDIRCVLMTHEPVSTYLPTLRDYPDIENIIARSEDDRAFTIKNLITTVNKMANADIFGIDKYLNWGVSVFSQNIRSSQDRKTMIEEMASHLKNIGLRKTLIGRCESVAEELLMNAIYDAPTSPDGKSKYNHLDRKETVDLEPYEEATFKYACDGMYVAVSVSDPFGGLTKKVILDYLENNYLGAGGQIDSTKGGGGHGLHVIVESSDLLIFNVKESTKTEVIALFQIGKTGSMDGKNPSFQFFYEHL